MKQGLNAALHDHAVSSGMPWLIRPAHGSGLDTRFSVGFLHALSQCSAADGASDMSKGVSNAIKISDRERGMPLPGRGVLAHRLTNVV